MTPRADSRWTVGDVAARLGVTVRTLHHYDEIGLLHPSERAANGYRLYTPEDRTRLRTIVLWRRLEISLEEIAAMLQDDDDTGTHLRRQRDAVMARRDELTELVRAIDNALEATMNNTPASTEDMREIFGTTFNDGYPAEAEQLWGDTQEWKQSAERTKHYTRQQWETIKVESDAVELTLLALFEADVASDDPRALDAAEGHRLHMETWFYDCGPRMLRNLAHLYVQDARFTASYDDAHGAPGFAAWVSEAMLARADVLDAAS
ncbi:MerR family transcriptional regulator [Aeromicrobium sp. CF3.5]|uniref:MerR family transcriptional regulator n=1 Tax=Aeromicrobium sp. CF3.5 TaxID=3373078 RepID=UPI003EE7938F